MSIPDIEKHIYNIKFLDVDNKYLKIRCKKIMIFDKPKDLSVYTVKQSMYTKIIAIKDSIEYVYNSIREAARSTNVYRKTINALIKNGKQHIKSGYSFRLVS